MAIYSSILAWRIPWTEEAGGLQSMRSQESDTTEQLTLSLSLSVLFYWSKQNILYSGPGTPRSTVSVHATNTV